MYAANSALEPSALWWDEDFCMQSTWQRSLRHCDWMNSLVRSEQEDNEALEAFFLVNGVGVGTWDGPDALGDMWTRIALRHVGC